MKTTQNFFNEILNFAKYQVSQANVSEASDRIREFDASLNIWDSMCYFIANELKIDPYIIMKEWACNRVLCTYGIYANPKAEEAYEMWRSSKAEIKGRAPKKYAVRFITPEMVAESIEQEQDMDNEVFNELLSIYRTDWN